MLASMTHFLPYLSTNFPPISEPTMRPSIIKSPSSLRRVSPPEQTRFTVSEILQKDYFKIPLPDQPYFIELTLTFCGECLCEGHCFVDISILTLDHWRLVEGVRIASTVDRLVHRTGVIRFVNLRKLDCLKTFMWFLTWHGWSIKCFFLSYLLWAFLLN